MDQNDRAQAMQAEIAMELQHMLSLSTPVNVSTAKKVSVACKHCLNEVVEEVLNKSAEGSA